MTYVEHVAIMKRSWRLTQKILTGQKVIESRWYMTRHSPWDKIRSGETVYFKDSGEPVTINAEVEKVVQFSDLSPKKVKEILERYGSEDGLTKKDIPRFFEMFKDKRYCILIFLREPKKIKPFDVDKTGFGSQSAWITVENMENIKKKD